MSTRGNISTKQVKAINLVWDYLTNTKEPKQMDGELTDDEFEDEEGNKFTVGPRLIEYGTKKRKADQGEIEKRPRHQHIGFKKLPEEIINAIYEFTGDKSLPYKIIGVDTYSVLEEPGLDSKEVFALERKKALMRSKLVYGIDKGYVDLTLKQVLGEKRFHLLFGRVSPVSKFVISKLTYRLTPTVDEAYAKQHEGKIYDFTTFPDVKRLFIDDEDILDRLNVIACVFVEEIQKLPLNYLELGYVNDNLTMSGLSWWFKYFGFVDELRVRLAPWGFNEEKERHIIYLPTPKKSPRHLILDYGQVDSVYMEVVDTEVALTQIMLDPSLKDTQQVTITGRGIMGYAGNIPLPSTNVKKFVLDSSGVASVFPCRGLEEIELILHKTIMLVADDLSSLKKIRVQSIGESRLFLGNPYLKCGKIVIVDYLFTTSIVRTYPRGTKRFLKARAMKISDFVDFITVIKNSTYNTLVLENCKMETGGELVINKDVKEIVFIYDLESLGIKSNKDILKLSFIKEISDAYKGKVKLTYKGSMDWKALFSYLEKTVEIARDLNKLIK